jgi:hypothetical protein
MALSLGWPARMENTLYVRTRHVNNPASLMAGWLDTYFPQASQPAAGLSKLVSGRLKGGKKLDGLRWLDRLDIRVDIGLNIGQIGMVTW